MDFDSIVVLGLLRVWVLVAWGFAVSWGFCSCVGWHNIDLRAG